MLDVVGISFKEKGRIYYFSPEKWQLKKNITVIVETDRGLQFGKVEIENIKIEESKLKSSLKRVIRIASKEDFLKHKKNIKDAKEALSKCKELVSKYKLPMQVIDATFTFDRDQLMFQFVSDNRVDFRELARDLASLYRTRIELRQVGVRDKAKEIGGCGPCGRELCCAKFLNDFDSVSINMAKNQNIALNPNKINGVCGRLFCCLKYEDDCYTNCRKCMPKVGTVVKTDDGEGIVKSVDIFKKIYVVDVKDKGLIEIKK